MTSDTMSWSFSRWMASWIKERWTPEEESLLGAFLWRGPKHMVGVVTVPNNKYWSSMYHRINATISYPLVSHVSIDNSDTLTLLYYTIPLPVTSHSLPGYVPVHKCSALIQLIEGRVDYMSSCSFLTRATSLNVQLSDSWEGLHLDSSGEIPQFASVQVLADFSWDKLQLAIHRSTTKSMFNMVQKMYEFVMQQKRRSERTISLMLPAGSAASKALHAYREEQKRIAEEEEAKDKGVSYTHTHSHTCTPTHPHTHMHTHAHTYIHTHSHSHTHSHTHTHTCTHTLTHTHTHTHTLTHSHTHTLIHTHTHTHTLTHTQVIFVTIGYGQCVLVV